MWKNTSIVKCYSSVSCYGTMGVSLSINEKTFIVKESVGSKYFGVVLCTKTVRYAWGMPIHGTTWSVDYKLHDDIVGTWIFLLAWYFSRNNFVNISRCLRLIIVVEEEQYVSICYTSFLKLYSVKSCCKFSNRS